MTQPTTAPAQTRKPPCNAVSRRYTAREAWTATARGQVGLYLSTEAGIIFVSVPCDIWRATMQARVDANGNPLPAVMAVQSERNLLPQFRSDKQCKSKQALLQTPGVIVLPRDEWPDGARLNELLNLPGAHTVIVRRSSSRDPQLNKGQAHATTGGDSQTAVPNTRDAAEQAVLSERRGKASKISRSSQVREERNAGGEATPSGGCADSPRKTVTVAELIERYRAGALLGDLAKEMGLSVGLLTAAFIRQGVALGDLNQKTA